MVLVNMESNISTNMTQTHFNGVSKAILNSELCLSDKKLLLKSLYQHSCCFVEHKGKHNIPKKSRDFLEKVFARKQWLTKEERQLISRKCGISPLQVRIWFINKRSRTK